MAPHAVVIEGLSKKFPTPSGLGEFTVIETLSLEIARGSFASIVGPSGCGKSTLLNIIAGIEPLDGAACKSYRRTAPMPPRGSVMCSKARDCSTG